MTDWRGLCEELVEALDGWHQAVFETGVSWVRPDETYLLDRARAALAQPEAEVVGPTDGEPPPGPFSEHDLRQQWNQQADEFNQWDSLDSSEQLAWAQVRAIAADRARWGRPAPAPAEGEVAELVAWLRSTRAARLTRAADLLERQAAPVPVLPEGAQVIEPSEHTILVPVPVPVAVSERMPEVEDCDAEGRCWWWRTDDADEWWEFLCITDAREYNAGCGSARYTHWLPAHALPLPSGEVEA